MGFYAHLETSSGDELRLAHSNGYPGGNVLVAFITALSVYCDHREDGELVIEDWSARFHQVADEPICKLSEALFNCWYINTDDDAAETPEAAHCWTDPAELTACVQALIGALTITGSDLIDDFDTDAALAELLLLNNALATAIQRGASLVRLMIL